MRLAIIAVGRLPSGPEVRAVADYLGRIDALRGRAALGPCRLREVEAKRAGKDAESALVLEACRGSDVRVALDERGDAIGSAVFAEKLGRWRDSGRREAAFLLGGADGHAQSIRDEADLTLSFGPMTWPHALARVMLAEQLYRAATILAGHPYHRA